MTAADELTPEQGWEIFDRAAREEFGISGTEFLRRWDRGELADADHIALTRLEMLMPLARTDTTTPPAS